jgi:pimeloyl-ACP methyl ester carboxylesterase
VLDTLLGGAGFDVLHPEARWILEELGYRPIDFDRAQARTGNRAQFVKAWTEGGAEVESKAAFYEGIEMQITARDLYTRAALLFGRAQYGFPIGDPRKAIYREAVNRCTEGVIRCSTHKVERIELPFEGQTVFAIAQYPDGVDGPVPLVLLLPGMDMFKEDWTKGGRDVYLSRGIATLAVDGPGQGETRAKGLPVTIDNYERAMSALIDHMVAKPEIDAGRIGLYGLSMGSYWGLRTAASDSRLKVAATAMGCYGEMEIIFERAQPSFKNNYMMMADYTDEDLFDREFVSKMGVQGLVDQIECPILMQYGEFDELSTVDDSLRLFERLSVPRRLHVYEQEFHSLGGVAGEALASAADWLELGFADRLPEGTADQAYLGRDGRIEDGDATPRWWRGQGQP